MSDLVIEPIDSVFIKVDCERSFAKELSDHFTFQVPGHKFMPAYRNKMWDGQIKLYNIYKQQIYAGLSEYVEQFAKDRSYSFTNNIPNREDSISVDGVIDYIKTLNPHAYGKSLVAHDHQIDAIHHALNHKRCLLLSPTGSGKSLIIYVICRYLLSILPKDRKILIIVPTISLVSQMYSDFFEYASKTNWKTRDFVHKIFGGEEKNSDKRIIVSTWQSIYKMPQKYFDQFGTVMGDECLHPDTKISMADGTLKDIKNIVIGDKIKTINELTKELETKQVLKVHKNISINEQMYEVCLNNNKIVKITGNHKVMLKTGEWKRVDELEVGNIINSIEGMTFDDQ